MHMKPDAGLYNQKIHDAVERGRFDEALAFRLEYLELLGAHFLTALGLEIEPNPKEAGGLIESKALMFDAAVATLEAAPSFAASLLSPDKQFDRHAAVSIFRSLANLYGELAYDGPLDGNRMAKIILMGGDLAISYSNFQNIETEIEKGVEAEERRELRRVRAAEIKEKNAKRSDWHRSAMFMVFTNQRVSGTERKVAIGDAVDFVKNSMGITRCSDGALDKAIQRVPDEIKQEMLTAVEAALQSGSADEAPEQFREHLEAALKRYGPFTAV